MRDKRIKVIYFSLGDSNGKEFVLSGKKLSLLASVMFLFSTIVAGAALVLFTDLYHNFRISTLTQTNATLRTQIYSMGQIVDKLESRMTLLEKENDDLGVFADKRLLPPDVRKMGVGGQANVEDQELEILPNDIKYKTKEIQNVVEELGRKLSLYESEREYLVGEIEKRQIRLDHRPSIRPIDGGRVSDDFGYRTDPFTRAKKHHDGLDLAIKRGTPVIATADGIVVKAKTKFTPNVGYGKEIVIDHGRGIQTRYAHLEDVTVSLNQKITRNEAIGTVGSTGKSTGAHLHYEVLVDGKPVDPEKFILNEE